MKEKQGRDRRFRGSSMAGIMEGSHCEFSAWLIKVSITLLLAFSLWRSVVFTRLIFTFLDVNSPDVTVNDVSCGVYLAGGLTVTNQWFHDPEIVNITHYELTFCFLYSFMESTSSQFTNRNITIMVFASFPCFFIQKRISGKSFNENQWPAWVNSTLLKWMLFIIFPYLS